ncbi:MAG: hypothetical protein COA94_03090 [Rickettsiales bacterium]|nr:MAG: hypothetical protein COA94_03090 [Rickettsiales bacterium]
MSANNLACARNTLIHIETEEATETADINTLYLELCSRRNILRVLTRRRREASRLVDTLSRRLRHQDGPARPRCRCQHCSRVRVGARRAVVREPVHLSGYESDPMHPSDYESPFIPVHLSGYESDPMHPLESPFLPVHLSGYESDTMHPLESPFIPVHLTVYESDLESDYESESEPDPELGYSVEALTARFSVVAKEPGMIDECEICSSTSNVSRICLPCGHKLHDECVSKWSARNPSCPMCRADF